MQNNLQCHKCGSQLTVTFEKTSESATTKYRCEKCGKTRIEVTDL